MFSLMVNGELLLSLVNWFQEHPERHMHQSGTSEIWYKHSFEPLGPGSLITVQRIQCKFVGTVQKLWSGNMFSLFCHLKATCQFNYISMVLEVSYFVCMSLPLNERLSSISAFCDSCLAVISNQTLEHNLLPYLLNWAIKLSAITYHPNMWKAF